MTKKIDYDFHDYKTESIAGKLKWSDELGWETLLNRAGTTFRKLPEGDTEAQREEGHGADARAALDDQAPGARSRRQSLAGFKPEVYEKEVSARSRGR